MAQNDSADKLSFLYRGLVLAALLPVVFVVMVRFWPVGPDYFYTFRPLAEAFFKGETRLFDASSPGYFNAPWAIFLIAPTLLLPLKYGQAVISMVSVVGLLLAIHVLVRFSGQPKSWAILAAIVLAAANLYTFDLAIRGNVDGFLLLGLGLGWLGVSQRQPWLLGLGLWLLSIKPVNVVLPALVCLWATRRWSRQEKLVYLAPLGLTVLVSLPVFGFDWPGRYLYFMSDNQPLVYLQTSWWRAFAFFKLPAYLALWAALPVLAAFGRVFSRYAGIERQERLLALAIATNLVISPYTLGSHYTLLAPVFVLAAARHKALLGLWLLTLTPMVRAVWGFEWAWIDIFYPTALMIVMFRLVAEDTGEANKNPAL